MKVYLLRHAIAEDRDEFAKTGLSDDQRPLTKRGREKLKKAITGFQNLNPKIDEILTSPYVRADQTAKILASELDMNYQHCEALAMTGSADDVLNEIEMAQNRGAKSIVMVGHEPNMNLITSWLTTGKLAEILLFKKAGICCLQFEDRIYKGGAEIVWFMGPSQLIELTGK